MGLKPSWRLGSLDKDLICFFPVRGLAFTSLKVGVGHRLDSQASGVLGRWYGEPGCSDRGLGSSEEPSPLLN